MKLLLHMFVIVGFATRHYSCNVFLIKDYLKLNHLTTALLISCGNDLTEMMDTLVALDGFYINVLGISDESLRTDFNYKMFFGRYSHPHGVVVNLECNGTNSFLARMSKLILFHNERFWLMFSSNMEKTFNFLSPQNINIDAEIVIVQPVDVNQTEVMEGYNVYDAFNPSSVRGGRLNITQLGYWSKRDGFTIPVKQTKIQRRRDLRGINFRSVITLTDIPNQTTYLEYLNSNAFPHTDTMCRLMYHLFILIMDMHNFKLQIQLSEIWGRLDTNGKWHGAIGMLNRSEVDLSVSAFRWDNKRYGAFEWTTHSYHIQMQFIFRHPKSIDAANVFLSPFQSVVWYATIGLCVLSASIVRVINLMEKELIRNHDELSYTNSLLMVFGFIFQQAYSGTLMLPSSRVLTISVLLFSVILFQFYSSFIVGSLLTEAPKNIKTLKQLLNVPFQFGVDKIPYVMDNFRGAKEESTVQIFNKVMKDQEKVVMPLETGVQLMQQGGFVLNTDVSYAYIYLRNVLTDTEKCELQQIPYLPKLATGPAVPNKSPLKELIKISLRRISETGLLSYYNKVWYGTPPKCETSELRVAPVDIAHFSSAVYILVIGIVSSVVILIFEIIVHRFWKRKAFKLTH